MGRLHGGSHADLQDAKIFDARINACTSCTAYGNMLHKDSSDSDSAGTEALTQRSATAALS